MQLKSKNILSFVKLERGNGKLPTVINKTGSRCHAVETRVHRDRGKSPYVRRKDFAHVINIIILQSCTMNSRLMKINRN